MGGLAINALLSSSRFVYYALLLLTILSFYLLDGVWLSSHMSKHLVEIAVVISAFVKVSLVTEYFMELHYAPNWLRTIMFAWIFAVAFALVFFIATQGGL